jgi:hypothetical protein
MSEGDTKSVLNLSEASRVHLTAVAQILLGGFTGNIRLHVLDGNIIEFFKEQRVRLNYAKKKTG